MKDSDKFVYDTPREEPLIDFSDGDANLYDNRGGMLKEYKRLGEKTCLIVYLYFVNCIPRFGHVRFG